MRDGGEKSQKPLDGSAERAILINMNTNLSTPSAMQILRDLGVATVKVEFSGGNDEGGADSIVYLDASGSQVTLGLPDTRAYQSSKFDADTWKPTGWIVSEYEPPAEGEERGKWGTRPATPEEIRASDLLQVLEAPIYDRYGSFAGEFSVYGILTWDVATGKPSMDGQESYTEWVDI
jgi:hypothetical protein